MAALAAGETAVDREHKNGTFVELKFTENQDIK